jgi:hypothetical protein
MSADSSRPRALARSEAKKLKWYQVRNWLGMPLSVWLGLLVRYRFPVSPARLDQVIRTTVFAGANSLLHFFDQVFYSSHVRRAAPPKPPLFVIGHWRTGTTLLHEMLVQDKQFSFPNTYQVMAPHHFLLSQAVVPILLNHALPRRRPMDNMAVGFDRPQEDEFALCNLGLPSPYLRWAFPNRPIPDDFLDLEGLPPREQQRWADGLAWFVRRLGYHDARRTVLKSPAHTARVRRLGALFSGAQFIHIVRNPRDVFPSTVHSWRQLWNALGFQTPNFDGLEEFVLATFERMYRSFDRARPSLPPDRLVELRYEDLIAAPVEQTRRIYDRLGLAGFDAARPRLEHFLAAQRDYRTNRHELDDGMRRQIARRWRGYIERYGYDLGSPD